MDNQNEPQKALQPGEQDKSLDFDNITEQNWLFIKHYLKLGDVAAAYRAAGYQGESRSAPYTLFYKLKPKIEAIGEIDTVNRARLLSEIGKLVDLPLDPNKQHVSFSERLRALKFMASVTPEVKQQTKVSVLIVNRYQEPKGTQGDTDSPIDVTQKDVIDTEPLA